MMNNKLIWMCWFQGIDDKSIPELNQLCIKKWKELNPDYNVNILTNGTISDYVPEYFEIIKNSPPRANPAKSDLLRILLLSKYGGVWVDASVYPVLPLSEYYHDIVNQTGFFTYRFKPRSIDKHKGDRETVSWFLCADKPSHYLIESWKIKTVENFKFKQWKFYKFHETLCHLYDEDERVKHIIDNMTQLDATIPLSACKGTGGNWETRLKPSYMYKRPVLKL